MKKMIFFGVLFFTAAAVNAATISQTQEQTVDGENFIFDFNPGAYELGSTSSFTVSVQGDFNDISTEYSTKITIGGVDKGNFNRVSAKAYDVSMRGGSNINTYEYKLNFDLTAAQTEDFMSNSIVLVDFGEEVQHICGWWNFSNCNVLSGNAPYAEVEYTYEVSSVPIPGAVWLFGSALLGLAGVARRKKA